MTEHTHTEQSVCGSDRAPTGWTCTRRAGHDGPCAAEPVFERSPAVETAEYLVDLLNEEGDFDALGRVNPDVLPGFFLKRSGRRYYVRIEEVL